MAMGIMEQLSWLTTRVKRLCCAVDKIKESGAGSYKVYSALLFQNGHNNPTATVLQNTLGVDITWTRLNDGVYQSNTFDPSGVGDCATNGLKIFTLFGSQNVDSTPTNGTILNFFYDGNCTFIIQTVNTDIPPVSSDGVLNYTPIEIRVYE